MKIISWNVNGLRAAYKKDFLLWLKKAKADIVCLQEIKAKKEQLPLDLVNFKNYYSFFNPALRPGYAGTAVFSKQKPKKVKTALIAGGGRGEMKKFSQEGRVLHLQYPDFDLFNLYLPHGGRQKENLSYKLNCYKFLLGYFKKEKGKKLILVGDFNIAHKEIDLARPKNNKNNIMFTQKEREQIDQLAQSGFVDSFRKFNKQPGNFTWWPYFRNARQRNLGWRIDYIFASQAMALKLKNAFILKNVMGSDHCPVGIEI